MKGASRVPREVLTLTFIGARRGIDVVRNKIKQFAQKKVTLPPGRHKIVILDEADRYVVYGIIPGPFAHRRVA